MKVNLIFKFSMKELQMTDLIDEIQSLLYLFSDSFICFLLRTPLKIASDKNRERKRWHIRL